MFVLRKISGKFIQKLTITNNYVHMFHVYNFTCKRGPKYLTKIHCLKNFASIFVDIPILISMLYTDDVKVWISS